VSALTLANYLDPSFPKQILELVPVSVSGSSARFQVIYTGSPLPTTGDGGNNVNQTSGLGYKIRSASSGINVLVENYTSYRSLYLAEPIYATDSKTGESALRASAVSFSGDWPSLRQLPGPILEFSAPSTDGSFLIEITNSPYAGVIEYSDDPRFPTFVASTSTGASVVNSVGATGDTVDYFSLVVPTGTTYDRILLSGIAGNGSASYAIYKAGSVAANAVPVAAGQLASGSAVSDVTVGENLLTSGTTTISRLTEGTYTIKIERPTTGSQPSEIAYQLNFSSYIALPSFVGTEDTPFSITLPSATSTSQALTWTASGLPTGVNLTTSNNQFRLWGQTESNFNGDKTFSLSAIEAGNSTPITYNNLQLSITAVNDAPTLSTVDALIGGVEDTSKVFTYAELAAAANEVDLDGDPISFRIERIINGTLEKQVGAVFQAVQVGANGTLISIDDSFRWRPSANANGLLDAFEVIAVDASLASSPPVVVKINTAAVNDAPTVTVVSQLNGGLEDAFKEVTYDELRLASNAADVDGDALSFRIEAVNSGTLQKGSGTIWTSVTPGSTLLSQGEKLRWQGVQDANGLLDAFSVRVTDASLASATPVQVRVNTSAVDDAPQISALNAAGSTAEQAAPAVIDADIALRNPDNTGFGTGSLTVSVASAHSGDQLGLLAPLSPAIGTIDPTANGANGAPLKITFAAGVTDAQASQVAQAITFTNSSDAPPAAQRAVSFAVVDAERGAPVTAATASVTVTPVNDAPQISALNTALTTAEQAAPAVIDADVVLRNPDNTGFGTGSLTVAVAAAHNGDQLSLPVSVAPMPGMVGRNSATVQLGDGSNWLTIGTIDPTANGVNGAPLKITFAAGVTDAQASQVAQAITYSNSSDAPPSAQRALSFTVVDAERGASVTAATASVTVTPINDAPTLSTVAPLAGGVEDAFKEITHKELLDASNAEDVDGDALRFRIETVNSGTLQKESGATWIQVTPGATVLSAGEKLRWQGAQDANGMLDAFSVRVIDGTVASPTPVKVLISTTSRDDAPQLLPSTQSFSVLENQPFTTPFTLVNVDVNQTVNLSLEGSDASSFTISNSGQLALKQPADYETKQQYTVRVRATDATPALLSATADLVLTVLDQPDQRLDLTPTKAVFLPTLDTRVTLSAAYSQDAPLVGGNAPTAFASVISYDGASLNLASSSLTQPGITVTNNDRGQASGTSTVTISSNNPSQVSAFQLDFDVDSSATGPFTFSWNLAGASDYEQQTNSPVIVSPNADVFISDGALNLSSFQTPLKISTETKDVVLVNQQNVTLPYSLPIEALVSTDLPDQISVSQAIDVNAKGGDDIVDLKPLARASQPTLVNLLLGAGRDTIQLPTAASLPSGSRIQIDDFQLGFDRLQLADASFVTRRSDVLSFSSAAQNRPNPTGLDLRFAAVAIDLDPGLKTVLSGTGSLVSRSMALDPGSNGRQLVVRLTNPTGPSATLAVAGSTALPAGYGWAVTANGTTATLTLPPSFELATGLADLRNAVEALVAQASATTDVSVQLQWLDSADGVIATELTTVQITPQLAIGGNAPIKLELQPTGSASTQTLGSTAGDSIHLIANPSNLKMDRAFGGLGDDLLIAGDGDRLVGGDGADTLIAYRGLGATQLTGGVGDDLLIGGSNDALVGGAGNDVIVVRGLGNRLIGGMGSDLFVLADAAFGNLATGAAANRILDFAANDRLALNVPGLQRSDINLVDSASGVIVRLSDNWAQRLGSSDLAILQGVKSSAVATGQLLINQPASGISQATLSRVDLIDQTV
jgi:Bacterial Ig domain